MSDSNVSPQGEVLNKAEIEARLRRGEPGKRLIISPLLSTDQIADGAVDLRLASEFLITRRTAFSTLDIALSQQFQRNAERYQIHTYVPYGEKFVLHPSELILGSTFEYICLPSDLFAYILSRSCWGRLGLVVATAAPVNPEFKGCLTLEMVNLGEVPLTLYPGLPIAQLILHTCMQGHYEGAYKCPTGPKPSNVCSDKNKEDNEFWTKHVKYRAG